MRRIPPHYRLYVLIPVIALLGVGVGFGYLKAVNHFSNTSATGDPMPTTIETIKGKRVTVTKKVRVPGKTKTINGKTVFIPAHTKLVTTSHFVPGHTIVETVASTSTRTVGSTVFQTITKPGTTIVNTITGPTTTVTGPGSTVTQPGTTVTGPGTTVTQTVTGPTTTVTGPGSTVISTVTDTVTVTESPPPST